MKLILEVRVRMKDHRARSADLPANRKAANTAIRAALAAPEVIESLEVMGLEAKSSSSAELAAMLKSDSVRWAPLVKSIGFSADS